MYPNVGPHRAVYSLLVLLFVLTVTDGIATTYVVCLKHRSLASELTAPVSFILAERTPPLLGSDLLTTSAASKLFNRLQRYGVVTISANEVDRLMARGILESAQPLGSFTVHDVALTNDSLAVEQYALPIVGADQAWKLSDGNGVRVGILDTGIDWEHPDLRKNLAINEAEDINRNGTFEPWLASQEINGVSGDIDNIDQDGNGYADDVIGYDFVNQTVRNIGDDQEVDPIPADEQGHGTSVAGVVAAEANNHIGIAGLAYHAKLVTLRAFDATGNAEEDDIAAALVYAALNGVQVVNMSFGDGVDSPVMRDAIAFAAEAGCVLVSSVGNTGQISRQYPAGFDQVMAIGATNSSDKRAVFSSTGSLVTLTAPGEAIVTTAVGGRYRTVSGTSFSAPLVAAASALLLHNRPSLDPHEILGLLTESATDLGTTGWDPEYGAGRLHVGDALSQTGQGTVSIAYPVNEQEVDGVEPLSVTGSAYATLFDSYEIYVGRGVEPVSWSKVCLSNTAVLGGTLCTIGSEYLQGTDHVVRLVVKLKNGRTLESRRRIHVVANDTLRVISSELITAWNTDQRVGVLTITTNRPTQIRLIRIPDGYAADTSVSDIRFTSTHCITFPQDVWNSVGTYRAVLTANNGDTVSAMGRYDLHEEAMPVGGFRTFDNGEFAGYVLDDVRDVRDNGKQAFVMNNLSSGTFGNMMLMERNGFGFDAVDSTSDVWIPRGMGDANGNGLLEVFAGVVGKSVLFEQASPNGSPFERIAFADTLHDYNAAAMADVDNDGFSDLVMLSDSGCIVVSWKQGAWKELGRIINTTPPAPGNAENRIDEVSVAVGDFDGNGAVEIAFADTDADLTIGEYTGAGFTTKYVYTADGVGGSGYVAGGDVDGDGKPDVLLGIPDSPYPASDGEYGRQVWTYLLFSSKAVGTYAPIWTERVNGVRYGIGYRNGVALANVTENATAEILICAFPRLFAFTWDSLRQGVVSLLYRNNVVTPRFLTHDFSGNGIPELGMGITSYGLGLMSDFLFLEKQPTTNKFPTPSGLQAQLLTPSKVRLRWPEMQGARGYRVLWSSDGSTFLKIKDTTTATFIEIDSLQKDLLYKFSISALPADTAMAESSRSEIVDVLTGSPLHVVAMRPDSVATERVQTGLQVSIAYSGKLPGEAPDPQHFTLITTSGIIAARGRSVSKAGDSICVVTFDAATITEPTMLIHVTPLLDARGIPTEDAKIVMYAVSVPWQASLYLTKLVVVSPSELELTYSLPIADDAVAIAPYTLMPAGTVASVQRIDSNSVRLQLGTNPPLAALGTTYALTSRNVTSTSGVPITTGTGNTLSFVLSQNSLENVFVYPHPASIALHGSITFANLTVSAQVEILDQSFRHVRTLNEIDGNGGTSWNLLDETGLQVPPGLYYYRVTGSNTEMQESKSGLRKLMLMR